MISTVPLTWTRAGRQALSTRWSSALSMISSHGQRTAASTRLSSWTAELSPDHALAMSLGNAPASKATSRNPASSAAALPASTHQVRTGES